MQSKALLPVSVQVSFGQAFLSASLLTRDYILAAAEMTEMQVKRLDRLYDDITLFALVSCDDGWAARKL